MYPEYAYMKLRYSRWAVTPDGKSLVYVNVIQNGRLTRARLHFLSNRRCLKT